MAHTCGTASSSTDSHGPDRGTTVAAPMRRRRRRPVPIEPWRAMAFPVVKDLGRRPLRLRRDHALRAPGSESVNTVGAARMGRRIPIPKGETEPTRAGPGSSSCAWVAACKNALPTRAGARFHPYALLPQGAVERSARPDGSAGGCGGFRQMLKRSSVRRAGAGFRANIARMTREHLTALRAGVGTRALNGPSGTFRLTRVPRR